MFNEKEKEYSKKQGKEIPVWQSPKYVESRTLAVEIIKSGTYGLTEADFWILMNETKSGKMGYTGLIISHNGCLKINDKLAPEMKFDPDCVTINENGYNGSLVFFYCNKTQGIFETGEVSAKNCSNDYPYAMAEKRLFDRVVLKNSKLAYAGIYGEDEADEFRRSIDEDKPANTIYVCADCKKPIEDYTSTNGEIRTAEEIAEYSKANHGVYLCAACLKGRKNAN